MKTIKTLLIVIFAIILLIIGLLFSQANSLPVTLKFYHYETLAMPLWFLVIISALAGAVLSVVLVFFDLFKGSRRVSKYKRDAKMLTREVNSLKTDLTTARDEIQRLKEALDKQNTTETSPTVTQETEPEVETKTEE